jgi:hypothetical protein
MRNSLRLLSMSEIFKFATSDTRRPAPQATPSAALYAGHVDHHSRFDPSCVRHHVQTRVLEAHWSLSSGGCSTGGGR